MTRIIGRKQSSDNALWLSTLKDIEQHVTREELDVATACACAEIVSNTQGKRSAYAWSGGKDSLVVAHMCRELGITDCVFAHTELEYPAFLEWCLANKPEGCEVINTGQDFDWLAKHPNMLFPKNAAIQSQWYAIVQRAAIRQYFRSRNLDIIVVGHRKADGNYVGKGTNLHSNKQGVTRYSPLADWSHELILAYIHYHELAMPPIYEWKDGFRCGTHPWPSRMGMKSTDEGFADVYAIDPSVIEAAAEKLDSAAQFLAEVRR